MTRDSADLPTAEPASVGLDARVLDGPLARLCAGSATGAAALMVGGKLVWERTFRGGGPASRFYTHSVGKGFTAVAIALLASDGVLALDDPACRFLTEWASDARRAITIRHLLTMTSGLKLDFARFADAPDATAATLAWPLVHRPGSVWCYEQVTAHALVPIIVRACDRSPLDLLHERVLGPIGAHGIGWARDERGECLGWTGVLTSARDLLRFGELLRRGGRHGDRALIDPSFVAAMARVDPITRAATTDPAREDYRRRAYGLLTYVNETGIWPGVDRGAFALLGSFGNMCLIDPSRELVFARLVTPEERAPEASDASFFNAFDVTDHGTARLWRAVLSAFAPRGSREAVWGRIEGARLDVLGALHVRARRRGLMT